MSKRSFTEGTWRRDPWFADVCSAFVSCKTQGDIANFLRDIGTLSELKALSERLQVARLIQSGRTYRQITQSTGASTTTVTRVASFLFGGEGGYRNVLKSQKHHHPISARGERMVSARS